MKFIELSSVYIDGPNVEQKGKVFISIDKIEYVGSCTDTYLVRPYTYIHFGQRWPLYVDETYDEVVKKILRANYSEYGQ